MAPGIWIASGEAGARNANWQVSARRSQPEDDLVRPRAPTPGVVSYTPTTLGGHARLRCALQVTATRRTPHNAHVYLRGGYGVGRNTGCGSAPVRGSVRSKASVIDISSNPVILHVGDSQWTLGGISLATGAVMLVAWIILLPIVARRFGEISRLTSEEAATLAMVGHETSYVRPEAIVHGLAAGKQWQVTVTIGDLRAAWQARRYSIFCGASGVFSHGFGGGRVGRPGLCCARPRGDNLRDSRRLLGGFSALMSAMMLFMMWAAVYTKLE